MRKVIKISESDLLKSIKRIISEGSSKDVICERCDWSWDISSDDEDPYLCHMCGHRNNPSENKEGVGAYDAPAFEMEPDHTTFRHEYSEQENGDENSQVVALHGDGEEPRYVTISFPEENFDELEIPYTEELPDGPIKILNGKFKDKEFIFYDGPNQIVKITYKIHSIKPGKNKNMWDTMRSYIPQEGDNSLIIQTEIKKVEIGNMDVTDNLRIFTNRGGKVTDWVKWNADGRVSKIARMFNLYVSKVSVLISR